jgi:Zn-dependent protease
VKWSWRIGRLAGIDIFVHMTFPLLLLWAGMSYYGIRRDPTDVAVGLAFVGMLFGIVVLHELGHALMARRFGIGTSDITLLPIGGVARLIRMPEEPRQEFLVALAGPAVNVVLAVLLGAVAALTDLPLRGGVDILSGHPVRNLFWVNIGLALFNMVPAFPMDGGRVLRSLLAMRLGHPRATRIAAIVGQFLALALGGLGLMGNPVLVLIAVFVWMGAKGEAAAISTETVRGEVPVRIAMITDFQRLEPTASLGVAAHMALRGVQSDFPVSEHGRLVGLLSADRLVQGIRSVGPAGRVEQVMVREVVTADSDEPIEAAFARLQASRERCMPVLTSGVLVGLLTRDHLAAFFTLQSAAADHHRRSRQPAHGEAEPQRGWR